MTALKPIENRRVRGVASERYPLNRVCAHPDCREPAVDPHHCFPRSQIGGDSWFVEITLPRAPDLNDPKDTAVLAFMVIPHVAGLCREHHDAVENHDAWIKLEDGVWNWYARSVAPDYMNGEVDGWILVGPLNPQPGSVEGKPKRKRLQGEARRKRRTISIKVPDDTEDGGAIWDETLENVKRRLVQAGRYDAPEEIPNYEAVTAALHSWLDLPFDVVIGEAA